MKHIGKGGLTGKVDINKTEIHDGDILTYPEHQEPYVIRWSDDVAGFVCESSDNFMLACVWDKMKIIGNIRDDLEFMEASECSELI